MTFYFTLRLNEVSLALNVLLCHPLSISLRATFLVFLIFLKFLAVK